ncbi:calmodulin-lysine N-methyltransferase [Brachionus plicatilis]|uniref:Calmodulin-lysine N-methyltransferase n=1 Tax=Brachionus plicatilis TaxID=10195 RepID=A0A3M7SFI0_BRAPC|nr:calmodulin-lysine N-methyltransferase [Brachionus plicatilis]
MMGKTCLIFAPNRQNSFHKFVDMAKIKFECMIVNDYDLEVWEKHLNEKEDNSEYDEDIHYPLLLKLKKRTKQTNDFCKMVFQVNDLMNPYLIPINHNSKILSLNKKFLSKLQKQHHTSVFFLLSDSLTK